MDAHLITVNLLYPGPLNFYFDLAHLAAGDWAPNQAGLNWSWTRACQKWPMKQNSKSNGLLT